jgi:hypothetical protein
MRTISGGGESSLFGWRYWERELGLELGMESRKRGAGHVTVIHDSIVAQVEPAHR